MLLATHPTIASEFNNLTNSTWLITSFALAGAATQTLVRVVFFSSLFMIANMCQYGKLSDIYGRKPLVIIAYSILVIGW